MLGITQFNAPAVDCHKLNEEYDVLSGMHTRFCAVVPFETSNKIVEAVCVLSNRRERRTSARQSLVRSVSCLSPNNDSIAGTDRLCDLTGILPDFGGWRDYYSVQEETYLNALAKETSATGGSSVLSRLSLSAIWRAEQRRDGKSFLSYVFPDKPAKSHRPSTAARTARSSCRLFERHMETQADHDFYADEINKSGP